MSGKSTVIIIHKASEVPFEPLQGKATLVYWNIVGLALPLRMALVLANVEWCDVRLECGHSVDAHHNKREWWPAKARLQQEGILEFPNLPYFLDSKENGGVRLVQSEAILRYLGRKCNLMGNNNGSAPEHRIDMLLEEARDLDETMIHLSYREGSAAVARWMCGQELQDKLNIWDDIVRKSGGPFVMGTTLTVVDLRLYAFLYKFQTAQATLSVSAAMNPTGAIEETPALPFWVPAYMESVETATPQLHEYLKNRGTPTNNPHALFDNL